MCFWTSSSAGGSRQNDPGLRRWQSLSHLGPESPTRSLGAELRAARDGSSFRQTEVVHWLQEAHERLESQLDWLKTRDMPSYNAAIAQLPGRASWLKCLRPNALFVLSVLIFSFSLAVLDWLLLWISIWFVLHTASSHHVIMCPIAATTNDEGPRGWEEGCCISWKWKKQTVQRTLWKVSPGKKYLII